MKDGSEESAQSRTELTCVAGHGRTLGYAERTPTRLSLLQESLGVDCPHDWRCRCWLCSTRKLACSAWQLGASATAVVGAETSGRVTVEAEKMEISSFLGRGAGEAS